MAGPQKPTVDEAKAAAEAKAKAADQGTSEGDDQDDESERLVVTGAAAVLRTPDGSERYLYRGAVVELDAFDEASIEHHKAAGLIGTK